MDGDDEFTPLPSAMQLEATGDTSAETRRYARAERARLRYRAMLEQVFSELWAVYGTGRDEDRAVAWQWWELRPRVDGAVLALPRRERTTAAIVDLVRLDLDADEPR